MDAEEEAAWIQAEADAGEAEVVAAAAAALSAAAGAAGDGVGVVASATRKRARENTNDQQQEHHSCSGIVDSVWLWSTGAKSVFPTMEHAMVSVATGVLSPVLGKLSTLLQNKYKGLKNLHDEILYLKDELSSMNALLLKLADMDELDVQVKEWRNQIRELSYDIEDCIDNFVSHVGRDSSRGKNIRGFFRDGIRKLRTFGARSETAKQILKLKARVDHVSERRQRYNFDGVTSCSGDLVDPRLPALYVEAQSLVGIDEPREELIQWLTEGKENTEGKLKVVSVVGLGGLGKTTLARQVYEKIGGQFDCRAFVSVSQKPDIKKVFKSILTGVRGKNNCSGIEACDEEQLIGKLRESLKDKRYLIVLDDIWSTVVWSTIRCALLENNLCSRILTTTRITSVAMSCCSPDYHNVCEMKPLSDVNAERLFVKRIFGSEGQCPSQLKEVSSDILRKCGGLPLAIITIASLLANKPCTKEQWERYRNSIGSSLENITGVSNMQRILLLSYNDLPHYLKTCLLYLSTFPEDFVIGRDQLVRRWIAEGFITASGGYNLEEVGEFYFNELINRNMIMPVRIHFDELVNGSMIMPVRIQYDGRADCCRVHDVILDLIVSKSIEENFITLFGNHKRIQGAPDKARRLSLDCRDQDNIIVPSSMVLSKARSFAIYGSSEHMPLLSDFQALRVIHIESNDKLQNHCLDGIGRLCQLKYLGLHDVSISKLPEQIEELQQLETLELTGTRIKELPKNIVRLKKLMFLFAHTVKLFEGISSMEALQELRYVKIDNSIPKSALDELGSLTALRYLGIDWCVSNTNADKTGYTDSFISCINRLCRSKLRYLHILCDDENGSYLDFLLDSWSPPPYLLQNFRMTMSYYFPRVPEWMASLLDLTFLDINISPVGEEVLGILGGLPSLLALWLWTEEGKLVIGSNEFQCLKELVIFSWNTAMGPLVFGDGAMPKLEKFGVRLVARGAGSSCGDICLGLPQVYSLKHFRVEIDCRGARAKEVQTTEDAVRNATSLMSSHIRFDFNKFWTDEIAKDRDEA